MEEILGKLEDAVITSDSKNGQSEHEALYKNWGRFSNQEERRQIILEAQKHNRNKNVDENRGILDIVDTENVRELWNTYTRGHYNPTIYVAGFTKTSSSYDNVLMLSEWFIEKPADFNENWYVVPCPKGVRLLVVANAGITKFFTKYGQFKFQGYTALPGGNGCSSSSNKRMCCVLDCFYQEKNNTMYILDILAWNSQPMTDGETEFRHFWLNTHLSDIPLLKYMNPKNEFIFTVLPKISCDVASFNEFMMTYPAFECNFPALDGLFFYHKHANYVSGETPLVGWLYPYMVQEVLGSDITVHSSYLALKPSNYVNKADFIQKFEAKRNKRKFFYQLHNSEQQQCNNDTDTTKETNTETGDQKVLHEGTASSDQDNNDTETTKETNMDTGDPKDLHNGTASSDQDNIDTETTEELHNGTALRDQDNNDTETTKDTNMETGDPIDLHDGTALSDQDNNDTETIKDTNMETGDPKDGPKDDEFEGDNKCLTEVMDAVAEISESGTIESSDTCEVVHT